MMKKLFSFSVIAISAMMCASMLTSCGDDDKSSTSNVPAQTGDRAIFQQHFKKNMKGIAENLNFTSWEVANNLNIDFNVNVLGNPAFGATLHQILTDQITANVAPASTAVQEKGYAMQSLVDLSQLHYRFTLKEDKSGFDVTPAECFELIHKADDGATKKESLIYTLNIIDHGTPNATQGIVAISQVLAVMRTLLAGSTAQQ